MVVQMLVCDPISGIDFVQRFSLLSVRHACFCFGTCCAGGVATGFDLIVSFLERFELQLKHVLHEEFDKT